MLNVAVLTGRLCADPELKQTQSGVSVVTICIAVDRRYKSGEDRQADFINVTAWRSTADFIAKYFHKGDMIGLQGSIQTRKYQDKDGNNRTAVEVLAEQVHFVGGRKDSAPQTRTEEKTPASAQSLSLIHILYTPIQEMSSFL